MVNLNFFIGKISCTIAIILVYLITTIKKQIFYGEFKFFYRKNLLYNCNNFSLFNNDYKNLFYNCKIRWEIVAYPLLDNKCESSYHWSLYMALGAIFIIVLQVIILISYGTFKICSLNRSTGMNRHLLSRNSSIGEESLSIPIDEPITNRNLLPLSNETVQPLSNHLLPLSNETVQPLSNHLLPLSNETAVK